MQAAIAVKILNNPFKPEETMMNHRDLMLGTLLFQPTPRTPFAAGNGRESTRKRWHAEGLPKHIAPEAIPEYAYRLAGGTLPWPIAGPDFPLNERMIPQFEEKVIERKARTQIVQDWKGNICEISSKFDVGYLRNAIDFVTRRWIKCPVENRDDWASMQQRYNADDPGRWPADPAVLSRQLADRTYFYEAHFSGPFWILREWLGFENLCMMFHDDPPFIRDMIACWEEFVCRLLRRLFSYVIPDCVHFSEDMAYKCFSMISPAMVREFLLPTYRRWGDLVRSAGVPLYAIDSDGYIGELIPLWMEGGVNCCDPIEVAAGNDIVAFRKEFGSHMAYRGGLDKRAMAAGGATLEKEVERLRPVIDSGGFVPGCDHGVPADVSWDNYVLTTKLLAQATGWL